MGAITAAGYGVSSLWDAVCQGRSMVRRLSGEGLDEYAGAKIDDSFDESFRDTERAIRLALIATEEAISNSKLSESEYKNVNIFVSSSKVGISSLINAYELLKKGNANCISPNLMQNCSPVAPAEAIAEKFDFGGMKMGFVSSCTTGIQSIIMGAKYISEGRGNIVLCGATEASITPLVLASYKAMGTLSNDIRIPQLAMKPFDKKRDGFVIGEGAGVLMLENLESARQRKAEIFAEITGWSYGCDNYGLLAHNPDGTAIAKQIISALEKARITPGEIQYMNAHGTATYQNDKAEVQGILKSFGHFARNINISSTKPVTGHLLGASGSIEAIISIMAIRDSIIPPTINLEEPEFNLNFTPKKQIRREIENAITVNFGFGGHIGMIVLAKIH